MTRGLEKMTKEKTAYSQSVHNGSSGHPQIQKQVYRNLSKKQWVTVKMGGRKETA